MSVGKLLVTSLSRPTPVSMAEVDPLQTDGQGEDTGDNYRTGIYTHDAAQEKVRTVVQGRL